jgi:metal-sulfur cluster biosynthetic enzyme
MSSPRPTESTLRTVLREVIDPEVGINIVDLGLIYQVLIEDRRVVISMTMTTPSCPMSGMLQDEVYTALEHFLGDAFQVEVDLVWEPPWSPALLSDTARDHFGWESEA